MAYSWGKVGESGENFPELTTFHCRVLGFAIRELTTQEFNSLFLGRHEHTVDNKGRVAIPAKFRAELGERMYVTRWLDKCLALYSAPAFEALAAKVSSLSIADPNARQLRRIFFSDAAELEFDRQGRINLPVHLREFAGVGADDAALVVVGMNDYIEIWAKDRRNEVQNQVEEDPNSIASNLAQLGVF